MSDYFVAYTLKGEVVLTLAQAHIWCAEGTAWGICVTCTTAHLFVKYVSRAFAFPAEACTHFTEPGGMEDWVYT